MNYNPPVSATVTEDDNKSIPPAYSNQRSEDIDKTNPFNTSTSSLSINTSSINSANNEKTVVATEDEQEAHVEKITYKWRFILRIFQMLSVIGSFGFQASANTWSGRDAIPFDSVALLYFFYAIEWLSFIWSSFCIYVCLSMKLNRKGAGNIKPAVGFAMDTLLAILLGVGISMEIGTYTCPANGFNGWCNFYNIGLCFGMLLFLSFSTSALWDLFSGLSCLRTKSSSNNLV